MLSTRVRARHGTLSRRPSRPDLEPQGTESPPPDWSSPSYGGDDNAPSVDRAGGVRGRGGQRFGKVPALEIAEQGTLVERLMENALRYRRRCSLHLSPRAFLIGVAVDERTDSLECTLIRQTTFLGVWPGCIPLLIRMLTRITLDPLTA